MIKARVQKKRVIGAGKQYFLGLIAAAGVVSALWCQSFVSLADSTGTITASSATIRKEMNTNSDALGSVGSGTTVSITDEVQDSSGTLWYQVSINGQTGYIRSDLMSKTDDGASSQSDGNQMPPGATVEPDTVLDAQYAVISKETVNVRTAPATNEGVVEQLGRDAQVIVRGETQGSDSKKWYYVTFTGSSGTEKSGFIRSDLLSLGEMVPVQEEEVPEPQEIEPEPEVVVNDDYALVYEEAANAWFIYDYTDREHPNQFLRYPLEELMKVTQARAESDAADAKTLVRQRVAIVILVVLLVLLIGVAVVMALKLRDIYYADDEDEEEEEETLAQRRRRTQEDEGANTQRRRREGSEETSTQRRRREGTEETPAQRRRRMEETEEAPVRRRRRMEDAEEETERSARRRPMRDERGSNSREVEYREDEAGSAPVQTTPKRKAKNFLLDDDEFEFEFLNMEDKDL